MSTGSEFVVVANRLPVDLETLPDGTTRWKRSPGGLVTALEPILRNNKGAWIGWPGRARHRGRSDRAGRHRQRAGAAERQGGRPTTTRASPTPRCGRSTTRSSSAGVPPDWWDAYVEVNRRFAEVTAKVAAEGATVWVQDYQLQLVPKMLRMLRPDLTIGFFLHIPFPPVELFMQMPWRTEIVEGLLGADLVGFHLPGGAQNFLYLARRLAGSPPRARRSGSGRSSAWCRSGSDRARRRVPDLDRRPLRSTSSPARREVRERAKEIRKELGSPRQDHARRRPARLHQGHRRPPRRASRSCSRTAGRAERHGDGPAGDAQPRAGRDYKRMRVTSSSRSAGSTASSAGRAARSCTICTVRCHARNSSPSIVAADVMLVTPLRDGMNLVAKEYVACRSDLGGALVL